MKNAMAYSKSLYNSTGCPATTFPLFESQIAEFQSFFQPLGNHPKPACWFGNVCPERCKRLFRRPIPPITAAAMTKQMVGASQSIVEAAARKARPSNKFCAITPSWRDSGGVRFTLGAEA